MQKNNKDKDTYKKYSKEDILNNNNILNNYDTKFKEKCAFQENNYSKEKITGKTLVLLEYLINYYSKNINVLTSIITQKKILSLRILDWLVTNYSKKYNVIYKIKKNDIDINFNVYLDYKNQLKAYSKKHFDPFCRRERILINIRDLSWKVLNNNNNNKKINNDFELITTVGQLNFFKWFMENNVLNYAIENIKHIDKDMIETLNNNNNKKEIKRKELSKSASKLICSYDSKIIVNFG